mgnify:CR=1 FL=1
MLTTQVQEHDILFAAVGKSIYMYSCLTLELLGVLEKGMCLLHCMEYDAEEEILYAGGGGDILCSWKVALQYKERSKEPTGPPPTIDNSNRGISNSGSSGKSNSIGSSSSNGQRELESITHFQYAFKVREYGLGLELWLFLCSIVVMFHCYWCIRKP